MNLKKSVKNQLKWAKVINSQLTEEKNVIVYNDLKLMKMHSASLVIKDKKKNRKNHNIKTDHSTSISSTKIKKSDISF